MFLGTWMCELVISFQVFIRDVGINLCRGQRGVSQQLLHRGDVGPAVEHVGGEGMPQHVRAEPRRVNVALEHRVHCRIDLPP